jgi:hypothetical protein
MYTTQIQDTNWTVVDQDDTNEPEKCNLKIKKNIDIQDLTQNFQQRLSLS